MSPQGGGGAEQWPDQHIWLKYNLISQLSMRWYFSVNGSEEQRATTRSHSRLWEHLKVQKQFVTLGSMSCTLETSKTLSGNKIGPAQNVLLCSDQLILVQQDKPPFKTRVANTSCSSSKAWWAILYQLFVGHLGRRPGCEWPAVLVPRNKRTDLWTNCPPAQF